MKQVILDDNKLWDNTSPIWVITRGYFGDIQKIPFDRIIMESDRLQQFAPDTWPNCDKPHLVIFYEKVTDNYSFYLWQVINNKRLCSIPVRTALDSNYLKSHKIQRQLNDNITEWQELEAKRNALYQERNELLRELMELD